MFLGVLKLENGRRFIFNFEVRRSWSGRRLWRDFRWVFAHDLIVKKLTDVLSSGTHAKSTTTVLVGVFERVLQIGKYYTTVHDCLLKLQQCKERLSKSKQHG